MPRITHLLLVVVGSGCLLLLALIALPAQVSRAQTPPAGPLPAAAPTFGPDPLLSPANGTFFTATTRPAFAWTAPISGDAVVSYTLWITGPTVTLHYTSSLTTTTPTVGLPGGSYTWTVQAHTATVSDTASFAEPPFTFTVDARPAWAGDPLLSPANGSAFTEPGISFDWAEPVAGEVVSYTLQLTGPTGLVRNFATVESQRALAVSSNGSYTWTVQAFNAAGEGSGFAPPYSFSVSTTWQVYLPALVKAGCPAFSANVYDTIEFLGPRADRPGPEHADLNLALRGYSLTGAPAVLVAYNGGTDANAPQLDGMFDPDDYPGISSVYRVNNWNWLPYPEAGTVGGPITDWDVTLMGLKTAQGEPLAIPRRGPEIYGGGYRAMVVYAEARRLTLVYTRDDTVANGYAVHLENLCVDPNLLALYEAQTDAQGWHTTGRLPALRNDQPLGVALGDEVLVAIRDRGKFMDPRSQKDWWMGYPVGLEIQKLHDTSLK